MSSTSFSATPSIAGPITAWLHCFCLAVALAGSAGCSSLKKPTLTLPFMRDREPAATANYANDPAAPKTLAEKFQHAVNGNRYDPARARQLSDQGKQHFQTATQQSGKERMRGFQTAAKKLKSAASYWPGSSLAEESLMLAGDAHYFADEYPKAATRYGEVIKQQPNSRYLDLIDQRRFEIARYWLKLAEEQSAGDWVNTTNRTHPVTDTFGHAVKLLDRIRFDNPTGKVADDATMLAAQANFRRGKFSAADVLFTDIRENFPHSEHQFDAHFLGLKCKQELYDGPDYDGSVLRDGEKIVRQMVRIFPEKSREHKEYLEREFKDIRLKLAQREFSLAQYYDNRKEYGAARVYYDLVRREYKDTNLSLESETRLAQIGGLPEAPENSLQWLADMFPEEEQPKPLLARDTIDTIKR
jgi:outer membrane protein assembly factor BamD (BamD/ComL family)